MNLQKCLYSDELWMLQDKITKLEKYMKGIKDHATTESLLYWLNGNVSQNEKEIIVNLLPIFSDNPFQNLDINEIFMTTRKYLDNLKNIIIYLPFDITTSFKDRLRNEISSWLGNDFIINFELKKPLVYGPVFCIDGKYMDYSIGHKIMSLLSEI